MTCSTDTTGIKSSSSTQPTALSGKSTNIHPPPCRFSHHILSGKSPKRDGTALSADGVEEGLSIDLDISLDDSGNAVDEELGRHLSSANGSVHTIVPTQISLQSPLRAILRHHSEEKWK